MSLSHSIPPVELWEHNAGERTGSNIMAAALYLTLSM
jgi:hypothetical protein